MKRNVYKASNNNIINGYINMVTPKGDAETEQVLPFGAIKTFFIHGKRLTCSID